MPQISRRISGHGPGQFCSSTSLSTSSIRRSLSPACSAAYPSLEHIIITVPARMELWTNYDDYYGHFLRYDKAKLRALATACALDVVELKYFFVSLYPVMRSMFRRSHARPLETKPPSIALSIGLHALIGAAFAMEERVSFIGAIPGTSLLAVFSRRAG